MTLGVPPILPGNIGRFDELLQKAKSCLSLADLEAVAWVMKGERSNEVVKNRVAVIRECWALLESAGVPGARDASGSWDDYVRTLSKREYEQTACGSWHSNGFMGSDRDLVRKALLSLAREDEYRVIQSPKHIIFGRVPFEGVIETFCKTAVLSVNAMQLQGLRNFLFLGVASSWSRKIPEDEIRFYREADAEIIDVDNWCGRLSGWTL